MVVFNCYLGNDLDLKLFSPWGRKYMIRIAICEDNHTHQALIQSCIEAYPIGQTHTSETYLSGESFLDAYESGVA